MANDNEKEFPQTEDVRNAAREFGQSLRNSPKIRAFIEAQQKMNEDPEAQDTIKRFQGLQQLRAAGAMGSQDFNEMMELQQKLQNNPIILNFVLSQEAAAEFLQEVNDAITKVLGVDFGAAAGAGAGTC